MTSIPPYETTRVTLFHAHVLAQSDAALADAARILFNHYLSQPAEEGKMHPSSRFERDLDYALHAAGKRDAALADLPHREDIGLRAKIIGEKRARIYRDADEACRPLADTVNALATQHQPATMLGISRADQLAEPVTDACATIKRYFQARQVRFDYGMRATLEDAKVNFRALVKGGDMPVTRR